MAQPPEDDRWRTPGDEASPGPTPDRPSFEKPSFEKPPHGEQPNPEPPGGPRQPFAPYPQGGAYGGGAYGGGAYGGGAYGGGAYGAPRTLQPVRGLGTAAFALAVVVTAGEGISALTGFAYNPGSRFQAYDFFTSLTGLAWLAAFIVTCLWLVRVRHNSEVMSPTYHHARRWGWAWAGWIVPIVSFWFPFQVVRDALNASATGAAGRVQRPPVGLWWGTFLAGQVLTNAASRPTGGSFAMDDTSSVGPLHLLGAIAFVVSLVAWSRIVRTVPVLQSDAG